MTQNKALAKNTIILAIGQFVPKIIAMITLPIITKAFSTEEFGLYDLVISFASLFLPLMTLMIQQAVFRFIIGEKDEQKCKSYITSAFVLIGIISTVFLIIAGVIGWFITPQYLDLFILAIILYFSESVYDLLGQVARGYGKNVIFSTSTIVYSAFNMMLLLILTLFRAVNMYSVLVILTISYLLATIFSCYKLKIKKLVNLKTVSKSSIKEMLKYSIPIVPSSISMWIVNLSDRAIITYFLGSALNGIYAAATKIPNLLVTFYNAFNLAWTEIAAKSIDDKESPSYYSALINNMYTFFIGSIIILITFSPILFNILIDEKFHEGYLQMPILFLGIMMSCFVSFYGAIYIALKKTKQVGVSSAVGAVLNAVINILCIEKIGLYAASFSTVISFFIILLYRIFEIRKYIDIKYNLKNIMIGIIILGVVIFNYYYSNTLTFVINIIIMIIYNCFFNEFSKFVIKKLKEKIAN